MKYLIVLDESLMPKFKKHFPAIEDKPILRPMYIDTSGYSVYLTQEYVDDLIELSRKIVIEDSIKFVMEKFDIPTSIPTSIKNYVDMESGVLKLKGENK